MKDKKVCIITERFAFGGLEKYILDFLEESLKRNYEVTFITGREQNLEPLRYFKNVKIYEVDMSEYRNYTLFLHSVYQIVEILRKEKCNFVILHPFNSIIYGYLASIIADIPYSVVLHGPLSITFSIPPNSTYKLILGDILNYAYKVYCVSEDIIFLLKEMFPKTDNFTLFPNALHQKYFIDIPWDINGNIVFVSTFSDLKLKGVLNFIKLFKDLPEIYKRTIYVYGDGEALNNIKTWVRENNLEKYIKFCGFKEDFISNIKEKIAYGVAMARSAIELLATNVPVLLIGLDGPKGFINIQNFEKFFFSNFSGFHFPNINVDDFISQFEDIKVNPQNYRLANIVRERLNYEIYFDEFENDYLNAIKSFKGYDQNAKVKVFKTLLAYYNSTYIRDPNFAYNILFFSNEKDRSEIFLNDLVNQLNYYKSVLQEKEVEINELKRKLEEHEKAKIDLEEKVNNLTHEKNIYEAQLNKIYMSRFWKLASKYYKLKRSISKLPSKFLKIFVINKLKDLTKNAQKLKKIVFIYPPTVDWNIPLFQRPQHISLELSKRRNLVLYFTPNYKDKIFGYKKISDNLIISTLFDEFLQNFESFQNMWIFIPSTNNEISIWDIRKLKDKGIKIIYDYIDEINIKISPEIHISYKTFTELKDSDVDLITCVSEKLYKEMLKRFPKSKVLYLPNGVEYDHFKVHKDLDKINDFMRSIVLQGKPVIGYYGALAKWIDYELLLCAAFKNPQWSFVLIGVDYEGSLKEYLDKFPSNVYYLGHIPYKELPWYAIWFDVALIPFKKGEIAKATSPIKMYEYMALNKPIVATEDLMECYGYKGVLISKNECNDFIEKIKQALLIKDDLEVIKELDKVARENTWAKRAEEILEYIKQYEKKKNSSNYRNTA